MLNKINIGPKKQILIVYIFLILATLAVFWQVNHYDFVNFDDNVYVTNNIHIQHGLTLEGFRWAFSTTYAEFWHPLTWLSLMLDYQLYGMNAGGYHLTNLILHILSTLLLFRLFNRMTKSIWRSAFVAALFALHPLHVESVAWIAERKDVLSAFFWMLTLCFYVYYTEKPVLRRYLLVLFCFACGLMSKPIVVTLPIVMILLDYWPLGRFQSNNQKLSESKITGIIPLWQLKEKIPLFIFSAVFSIITIYAQYKPSLKYFPLSSRIANAPVSFVAYLEKMFWPHDLAIGYHFPDQLPVWQVWGAALLIIVISAVVILAVKRKPYLFAGWLWYAITLLPVIGIISVGDPMADRYSYLPSIGITIMLAWGIPSLIKREGMRKKILFPAGIAVLAILSILTWQQCRYWKNSISLCSHALQVVKDNDILNIKTDLAFLNEGKSEEAIDYYNKAIRITPNSAGLYSNRGNVYAKLGQYQRAIEDYNEAIRLKPDCAECYYNKATTLGEFGQYQNAIEDYNKVIHLKPDCVDAYYNRGTVYAKLGQYQHAIEDYNEAVRLQPDYVLVYYNRGLAYLLQGKNNLGCRDAQKACELGNCKLLEFAKGKGYCR